jgi:murein DD-endopeptidase MepM/ murein hydrolase activator NlpD
MKFNAVLRGLKAPKYSKIFTALLSLALVSPGVTAEPEVNLQLLDYHPPLASQAESFSTADVAAAKKLASFDRRFAPSKNAVSSQNYMWPVRGVILSPYGPRGRGMHPGVDIDGKMGQTVVAARAGMIITAGPKYSGYGNMVDILHEDGIVTRYGHASRVFVHVGQRIAQGEPIMAVGCTGRCTGPHVHFEVRIGGHSVNPMPYLR